MKGSIFTKQQFCMIFEINEEEYDRIKNDEGEIKKIYRKLVKCYHPDNANGDKERIKLINGAYTAYQQKNIVEESDNQTFKSQKDFYNHTYDNNTSTNHQAYYNDYKNNQKHNDNSNTETEDTQTEYQTKEKTKRSFLWYCLWPVRGIIACIIVLLGSILLFNFALVAIAGMGWFLYAGFHVIQFFTERTITVSEMLCYAASMSIPVAILLVFNLIEEHFDDFKITMDSFWRG